MKKISNLKNYFFIITLSIFILSFIGLPSLYPNSKKSEVSERKFDKLLIAHNEIFKTLQRPSVVFNHSSHSQKYKKDGCKTCHPIHKDGKHKFDSIFDISDKTAIEIKELYHKKCISCHEKEIKATRKPLPVRCGECHQKNALFISLPIVEFDFSIHEKHTRQLKNKCILCHHLYDKEEKELIYEEGSEQSCYYCHDSKKRHSILLEEEISIIIKRDLNIRKVSHKLCVNCHSYFIQIGERAGPVECFKCHTGKYKTLAELSDIPRPERDQPKKAFIFIEDGKMKGVPFDHTLHEKNTKTCKSCHHETLISCKHCHTLNGNNKGAWINTANAFHDNSSEYSCVGCHNKIKTTKGCAGCHHLIPDKDLQSKSPKKELCKACHTGEKVISFQIKPIVITELNSKIIPERVTVKILENEYNPSVFPHLKIIKKLSEISNQTRIASYFHGDIKTICRGCHHQSNTESELDKNKPPYCRNCHTLNFDDKNTNKPRLLAIYHRQCMGCHEKMKIKAIGCRDCHEEKNVSN